MDKKVVYKTAGLLLLIFSASSLIQTYFPFEVPVLSLIIALGGLLMFPFYFIPLASPALIFLFYLLIGGYFAWLGWKKKPENKTIYISAWLHLVLVALIITIGLGMEIFCRISGYPDCGQAMFAFILPLALLQALGFVVLVIGLVKQYVLK